jgi:glutaminase
MTQEKDDLSTLVHGMRTVASPLRAFLSDLHSTYKTLRDGLIADDIPELAKAKPDWFGICVADTQGQIYEVGDCSQQFTMQAIADPFIYGMVLEEYGREHVLSRVGVEPTSDSFEAVLSDMRSKHLQNPMLNAGAIVVVSMIKGDSQTGRLNHMLDTLRRYTGRDVQVDAPSFVSARAWGHRFRSLAHLMLDCGIIGEDIDETLDLFFQQRSMMASCRDLAVMAATIANRGVNPVTGEQAIAEEYVRDMLSVMYTCGLHDFSGEWAYRVGLPAKGGVSGGLIAVVPQQVGVAVFSPLLNTHGLSVRGIRVCEDLSREFGLHIFDPQFGGPKLREAMTERISKGATRGTSKAATARGRVANLFDDSEPKATDSE